MKNTSPEGLDTRLSVSSLPAHAQEPGNEAKLPKEHAWDGVIVYSAPPPPQNVPPDIIHSDDVIAHILGTSPTPRAKSPAWCGFACVSTPLRCTMRGSAGFCLTQTAAGWWGMLPTSSRGALACRTQQGYRSHRASTLCK